MAKYVPNNFGPNMVGTKQGTAAPASSEQYMASHELLLGNNGEVSYKRNHQNTQGAAYTSVPWAGTPVESQHLKAF